MSDRDSLDRDAAHDAAMSRAQSRYDSMIPSSRCELCGSEDCGESSETICTECGRYNCDACSGHFAKVELSLLRRLVNFAIAEIKSSASPSYDEKILLGEIQRMDF